MRAHPETQALTPNPALACGLTIGVHAEVQGLEGQNAGRPLYGMDLGHDGCHEHARLVKQLLVTAEGGPGACAGATRGGVCHRGRRLLQGEAFACCKVSLVESNVSPPSHCAAAAPLLLRNGRQDNVMSTKR